MSGAAPDPDGFLTPRTAVRTELVEKGSRFLCELAMVESEDEVRHRLAAISALFPDATHYCWAYRLGWPPRERSSDAREPAGTAGAPMLRVLAGRGLSDVVAVVVRWFGGVRLGRGGLARAYGGAVAAAVAAADLEVRVPTVELAVEISYQLVNPVKRLLRSSAVELVSAEYGDRVRFVLRVAVAARAELEASLADMGAAASAAGSSSIL